MTGRRSSQGPLSPELFLSAYRMGYFPMAQGPDGPVGFYCYDPRGIIPLDDRFKVRKSLRQIIRRGDYVVRFDTNIEGVLRGCARHGELPADEIWLSNQMIEVYLELAKRGIVHTVEAWHLRDGKEELAGGLYGLTIGSAFCGESMFSRAPYASQVALVALVDCLRERGFTLLDAQMAGEHLEQFGLYEMSQEEYLRILQPMLEASRVF